MCGAAVGEAFAALRHASRGGGVAAGASTGAQSVRNTVQKSIPFSKALSDTKPRVQSLHRDMLRSVPWAKRAYNVPLREAVRATPPLCLPRPCACPDRT